MADLSVEEFLFLARTARLEIPQEDVEPLTLRFNALLDRVAIAEANVACREPGERLLLFGRTDGTDQTHGAIEASLFDVGLKTLQLVVQHA